MSASVDSEDGWSCRFESRLFGWPEDGGVPAITDVDRRARFVRHIRDRGAMKGGVFDGAVDEPMAPR